MDHPPPTSLRLARARRLKRLGRRAVLWGLALYAAAQAGVAGLLDRWRPRIGEKLPRQVWLDKRLRLRQLAAELPDRSLVVMVGSSRTEGAFLAGRLGESPPAYNCGVPAAGPMHEYLFLREMLAAGLRPRLLVVEFLPPLLNRYRRGLTSEEGWLLPAELSGPELAHFWPYLDRRGHARRLWLEGYLAPCHAMRNDLHTHARHRLGLEPPGPSRPHLPTGELAEYPPPHVWPRRRQVAHEMYHESLRRFELGAGPARAFHDLLDCCRRERVPVALVLMPESTGFRKWYPPEALESALGLLDRLRAEGGAAVIDARDWVADDDFFDGHHVLPRGAEVFTDRLAAELAPLLATGVAQSDPRSRSRTRRATSGLSKRTDTSPRDGE